MLNLRTIALLLGLSLVAQSAYAADEVPPTPQRREIDALHEQAALESTRYQLKADAEAREEQRELQRIKHVVEMARYKTLRDRYTEHGSIIERTETSARDALMKRRLFLPDLFTAGVSIKGGLFSYAGGIISVAANSTKDSAAVTTTVTPSVDIRVGEHVTVGGLVVFSHTSLHQNTQRTQTATGVQIAPRVGYLIPVGSTVILWPKGRLNVTSYDGEIDKSAAVGIGAEVAAVIPLSSRIYASVAPQLGYSISNHAGNSDEHGFAVSVESRFGIAF